METLNSFRDALYLGTNCAWARRFESNAPGIKVNIYFPKEHGPQMRPYKTIDCLFSTKAMLFLWGFRESLGQFRVSRPWSMDRTIIRPKRGRSGKSMVLWDWSHMSFRLNS